MTVAYHHYREFPGWLMAPAFLASLVEREASTSVLEIGAGANPTLAPEQVRTLGVRYTTNDRSADELAKADAAYETLLLDMAAPSPATLPHDAFDLVFSRMVNEHVDDGERYYRNIFTVLRPGGVTAHCFSTLYALPFVVNRLLPERLAGRVLDVVSPREDPYMQDKFPARYSWSRGPTPRALARLRRLGYEVLEYRGYFGHPYYDRRVLRPLKTLEEAKAAWLCRHPIPAFTSYGVVILRKPLNSNRAPRLGQQHLHIDPRPRDSVPADDAPRGLSSRDAVPGAVRHAATHAIELLIALRLEGCALRSTELRRFS